jgi:arylsulfate sulfotransferase
MSFDRVAVVLVVLVSCMFTGCGSKVTHSVTASITPVSADILTGGTVQFTANISTDPKTVNWYVNGIANGNATVGTIDASGNYTAPMTQPATPFTISASSSSLPEIAGVASVTVVAPGQVTGTANAQVALYTIAPPVAAAVTIQFGLSTTYGLSTSTQTAAGGAAPIGTFVAGMQANSVYHMRATLQMPDGSTLNDLDQTFSTGALPAGIAQLTATTTSGMTPQPGLEMLDLLEGGGPGVVVSDLSGNPVWTYSPGGTSTNLVQPVKPLPNGHFLVVASPNSTDVASALPAGTLDVAREIDLSGATIREISIETLNDRLAAAGFSYQAQFMHHDTTVLPNGHWIVIVNSIQPETEDGTAYSVIGDALIDLDPNLNPVWVWNTFDHMDVTRHPVSITDWTHSNAILYSPTDGNLLLSMRDQNWIIKIDYNNGAGAGDILWHLGYQGDFTMVGGTDPTDWFSGQHGPAFTTPATAGTFGMTVFDDGDFRTYPTGVTCGDTGAPTCPYSTAQVFTINESAMTATFDFFDITPAYSFFGGNEQVLGNGNVEFDLCGISATAPESAVYEVTPTSPAQTVWQLNIVGDDAYRAFRIPSLYPGVQW